MGTAPDAVTQIKAVASKCSRNHWGLRHEAPTVKIKAEKSSLENEEGSLAAQGKKMLTLVTNKPNSSSQEKSEF